jgi:hypothetical protein
MTNSVQNFTRQASRWLLGLIPLGAGIAITGLGIYRAQNDALFAIYLGVGTAIAGLSVLFFWLYRTGFIKRIAAELFPPRDQVSREAMEEFFTDLSHALSVLEKFSTKYERQDQLTSALDFLPALESRNSLERMASVRGDLAAAVNMIDRCLNYVIEANRSKNQSAGTGVATGLGASIPSAKAQVDPPRDRQTYRSQQPPAATNAASAAHGMPQYTDTSFNPSVVYTVTFTSSGHSANMTGHQISELLQRGLKLGSDFFVAGFASQTTRPPQAPGYSPQQGVGRQAAANGNGPYPAAPY